MYHKGNFFSSFDDWWKRNENKYDSLDITKKDFENYVFKRGFSKGDILFIIKPDYKDIKLGDVIIFEAGRQHPIIHRVINIKQKNGKYYFSTIGDNNVQQLSAEKEISEDKIVGKAIFRISPYIGWAKLIFYEPFRPESEKGFCQEN